MAGRKWVPLHVHSEYSNLDGAIRIKDYADYAQAHDIPVMAVTDHGVMSAAVDMDRETKDRALKPFYGCELYSQSLLGGNQKKNFHLLALAWNSTGYRNLVKIASDAQTKNFYMKGRVSREILEGRTEGIVFSSACIQGELSQYLLHNDKEKARRYVEYMRSIGEFYIELIDTGPNDPVQMKMNRRLYDLAKAMNVPVIMTPDAHYLPQDRPWHDCLVASAMQQTLTDLQSGPMAMKDFDLSLPSPEQMWDRWGNLYPDALENTCAIAERVQRFPIAPERYQMPKKKSGGESLHAIARRGLARRMEGAVPQEYVDRLEHELGVVTQMGFCDYFIMVQDMVNWARAEGINVGPGRGSAAGSLLAWSCGITQIDPIQYGLLFERFLNPERVSMPDIDVDFEDTRRDEVIAYLRDTYGDSSVSGIVNFTRSEWKMAIRDAGRVLGYGVGPGDKGDLFAKSLNEFFALAEKDEVSAAEIVAASEYKGITEEDKMSIATLAGHFRGLVRGFGRHASGIVIAPGDISDYMPLCSIGGRDSRAFVTQYDMDGVDHGKLIKMDILGLSTLSMLRRTVEIAGEENPTLPDMDHFYQSLGRNRNTNDGKAEQAAYEKLSSGDTTGIFQMHSPGMRRLLREIRPDDIDGLSAINALYRPGPKESGIMDSYRNLVKGLPADNPFPESVRPLIEKIASDAKGLPIYQEHVMRIAQEMAGYSLAEADLLRRAMGKKKVDVMEEMKADFISRSAEKGYAEEDAEQTFRTLEFFTGYGFNKSHSVAYAVLAWISAWYKANTGPAFMAAFLESKLKHEQKDKTVPYIREIQKDYILLPPIVTVQDKTLGDAFGVRPMSISDVEVPSEQAWRAPEMWALRLGLDSMRGVTEKSRDRLKNVPAYEDYIQTACHVACKGDLSPKEFSRFTLSGVFDYPILKVFLCDRDMIRFILTEMNRVDEEGSNPIVEELMPSIDRCLSPLLKRGSDLKVRIRKANRDFFTGFCSLYFEALKKKQAMKRNPWSQEKTEQYVKETFAPFFRDLVRISKRKAPIIVGDPEMRVRFIQNRYLVRMFDLGEGFDPSPFDLAAEFVGFQFAFYSDELNDLSFKLRQNEVDFYVQDRAQKGLWVLGCNETTFFNPGKDGREDSYSMLFSGRWGSSAQRTYLALDLEMEQRTRSLPKGGMLAAYVVREGYRWVMRDFRQLSIEFPISEGFCPMILPDPRNRLPLWRIPEQKDCKESKYRALKDYIRQRILEGTRELGKDSAVVLKTDGDALKMITLDREGDRLCRSQRTIETASR